MKNSRIEKNGVLTIDPLVNLRPSDEIDPDNPFIRKKAVLIATTRKCKTCGTEFILHGPYDPKNLFHDLCDDCILETPATDQHYPEKTIQIEQSEIETTGQEFMEPGEELAE
jgi:hypothetical protein